MALVALVILVTSGRPIFYRGDRYGLGRDIFQIYKFRTLKIGAEQSIGDATVKDSSDLVTPIGKFFRKTRLDELPQVWNVVRGDMNLVGPRPVRPIIAARYEEEIPNYDRRFQVRPGIVGHVQIFMPHGASKRFRARYNNILLNRDVNVLGEIYLILFTVFRMFSLLGQPLAGLFRRRKVSERDPTIEFGTSSLARTGGNLVLRKTSSGKLVALWVGAKPPALKEMHLVFSKKNHLQAKVRVPVNLNKTHEDTKSGGQVFDVSPKTAVGKFLIDRHVLSLSFAS